MQLLAKYLDAQGNSMSVPWMTKAERNPKKVVEKPVVTPFEVEGDLLALLPQLDKRAHPVITRLIKKRIDPWSAGPDDMVAASKAMGAVLKALQSQPYTMHDLVALVASQCALSALTAKRNTYAAASILTACDRVKHAGLTLEIA